MCLRFRAFRYWRNTGSVLFREFSTPYLNKIVEALRDYAEIGTIIHICGQQKCLPGIGGHKVML